MGPDLECHRARYVPARLANDTCQTVTDTRAVYVEQNQDPNTAENFATNIKSEESKAMALLLCGKLKSAYLSAIKTSNLNTVLAIRDEAKKRGAKRELELCEKFIASKTSQGAAVTNNNTSISGGNNNNK